MAHQRRPGEARLQDARDAGDVRGRDGRGPQPTATPRRESPCIRAPARETRPRSAFSHVLSFFHALLLAPLHRAASNFCKLGLSGM